MYQGAFLEAFKPQGVKLFSRVAKLKSLLEEGGKRNLDDFNPALCLWSLCLGISKSRLTQGLNAFNFIPDFHIFFPSLQVSVSLL